MTAARDRQRLRRSRVREGKVLLSVEVDEAALCIALVDGRFIQAGDEEDRRALGQGLSRLIDLIITLDLSRCDAAEIQKLLEMIRATNGVK